MKILLALGTVVALAVLILLPVRRQPPAYLPTTNVNFASAAEIPISRWQIAGPFAFAAPNVAVDDKLLQNGLANDFLAAFGGAEADKMAPPRAELWNLLSAKSLVKISVGSAHDYVVRLERFFPGQEHLAIYARAQLVCRSRISAIMLYAVSGGVRAWLNGHELLQTAPPSPSQIRDDNLGSGLALQRVDLQAGPNVLVFKICQKAKRWGFRVSIATTQQAQNTFRSAEPFWSQSLNSRVFHSHAAFEVLPELVHDLRTLRVGATLSLDDLSGRVLQSSRLPNTGRWSIDSSNLPEGLYRAQVTGEACDYSQWLLLGDPATELARLRQTASFQRDHSSGDAKLDREALLFRFRHLYRQDHYQPNDDDWQRKIVFTLCEYAAEVQRGGTAGVLRGRPGTHIRGFRSRIDGQAQYYVVHTPKQSAMPHTGLPVVVLVPYETLPRRPFLESVYVAKIGYAESLARLGRQYGFVVVQVGGRNITDGNPIAETDILEVLADLSHDIAIDPRRIYLLGASRGGTNALLLAERHPGKFAAVAAVTPLTNLGLHRNLIEDTDSNSPSGFAGDTWLQSNSPVNLVGSLRHTPVYIMAGEDDLDVKLDEIREFVDRCHAFGVYPKVDVVKGMDHLYYPIAPDPIAFDFFSGKVTDDHPASITMQTATINFGSVWWLRLIELMKPNQVATIEARLYPPHTVELRTSNVAAVRIDLRGIGHVVGGKMLLAWNNKSLRVSTNEPITVALREDCITQGGESGSRIQGPLLTAFSGPFILVGGGHQNSSSAENLISRLAQKWNDNYFVKCRTMSYGSLSSTDRTENNLVFAPASIVQAPTQLPIESHKDSITVGGVRFAGSSLWYQSLYPNPWNSGKYIVLIGTNNSAAPFCGETDIFTRGRYDVAVWDCSPSNRRLLAAGYWDSEWKTLHSY
jgi:hypothetical protein